LLHIAGLTAGETLAIYSASGQIVHNTVVTADEADIRINAQGLYIIVHAGNTLKVVFEN
jgi:hypothetical protein